MSNPYISMLDILVGDVIEHDDPYLYAQSLQKDEYEHWEKDNEWVHASVANYAIALAYSYIEPESRYSKNKDILLYAEKTINRLVDAAVDDRWYHKKPRMGDANIDRFAALPLIESIHLLGNILSSEIRDNALKKLDAVLQVQLREYEERGRIYPNMDAYYCHGEARNICQIGTSNGDDKEKYSILSSGNCFLRHG